MTEKEWMEDVKERLEQEDLFSKNNILFSTGKRVPYSFEILNYKDDEPGDRKYIKYETDLLVCRTGDGSLFDNPRLPLAKQLLLG